MNMETNLRGRVHHTKLPKSHALLPLFESVVNSIHAIEEKHIPFEKGKIVVRIIREESLMANSRSMLEIKGFKVADNGIGFNEDNFKSFKTLDSDYKAAKGCKGIGRLLWLKAFKNIFVISAYSVGDKVYQRKFEFNAAQGVTNDTNEEVSKCEDLETIIFLSDFLKPYRESSSKSSDIIARSLLGHCLWYFLRQGGGPVIEIKDGDETISLDDIYEKSLHSRAYSEKIKIKGSSEESVGQ